MSDAQQGPGWWLASDGKWYPPQTAPQAPPQAYPPPLGGYGQPSAAPTNSSATAALVLGILSMFMCGLLAGIPAVIMASKARKEIRASAGTQGGDGMAVAGLVLGCIGTALSTLAVLAIVAVAFLGSSTTRRYAPVGGTNTDPSDGYCNEARFVQDPDC